MSGREDGLGTSSDLEGNLPAMLCGLICQSLANLCTKQARQGVRVCGMGLEAEGREGGSQKDIGARVPEFPVHNDPVYTQRVVAREAIGREYLR